MRTRTGWTTAILAATLAAAAQAQQIPGTVRPGQIERQFIPPPEPSAQPTEIQIPPDTQRPPANAEQFRFTLEDVVLDGATVYPPQALRAEYESQLGREVSLADIYAIADRLTARYRNDGYVISQVVVPAQSVQQGVVRLQAVEGYVREVRLEGDALFSAELPGIYADRIKRDRPLTAAALERYLLLMNDLAGTTARATLAPSATQPGAADLHVKLAHLRFEGEANLDNRGSESLGPWWLTATLDANSLFGRFDRTGVRLATSGSRQLALLALTHAQPVGSEGGKLGVQVSAVEAVPDLGSRFPATLETSSRSTALSYTHPLIRSRNRNLYLRAALTAHDGETEIDRVRTSEDRIRALRLGATFDLADGLRGINLVDLELSQGLNAFGARRSGTTNVPLSRDNGDSDFTKIALYAARLQSIAPHWSVLAALSGQYAFSNLLSPELFGFGGEVFGRGYDPSELVGDSGAAAKLELRYMGAPGGNLLTGYTAYAFYDIGTVQRRTPQNERADESAASAGLGVRLTLARNYQGFVELAKPLTRDVGAEGDRDWRAYAGVSLRF